MGTHQRADVGAVPAAGIVAEAVVALVLADAVVEKFGGDSMQETRRNAEAYPDTLRFRCCLPGWWGSVLSPIHTCRCRRSSPCMRYGAASSSITTNIQHLCL